MSEHDTASPSRRARRRAGARASEAERPRVARSSAEAGDVDGAGAGPSHVAAPGADRRVPSASPPRSSRPSVFSHRTVGQTRSSGTFDLLLVLASFALMHVLYLGDLDFTSDRVLVLSAAVALLAGGFAAGGLYRQDLPRALHEEIGRLSICWALALAGIGLFAFLSKTGEEVSRVWVGSSMLLTLLLLVARRAWRAACSSWPRAPRPRSASTSSSSVPGTSVRSRWSAWPATPGPACAWWGCSTTAPARRGAGARRRCPTGASRIDGEVAELFDFVEARRRDGRAGGPGLDRVAAVPPGT